MEILSAYKFQIQHRPAQHKNADALSRISCRQCGFQSDCDKDEIIPQSEIRTISENKVKAIDRDDPSPSLREKQNEDTDVSLMKNWIKENTRPDFSKIKGRGYVLQSLWSQWNRLTVPNDLLYRKFEEVDGKTIRLQAIVPISQRRTVLEFCHDVNTAAYLGVSKTLARIRKNFYWP